MPRGITRIRHYFCKAGEIALTAKHAFLGDNHRLSLQDSRELAQSWCQWFCQKHVPHVVRFDPQGTIVQIYKVRVDCCPLHQMAADGGALMIRIETPVMYPSPKGRGFSKGFGESDHHGIDDR